MGYTRKSKTVPYAGNPVTPISSVRIEIGENSIRIPQRSKYLVIEGKKAKFYGEYPHNKEGKRQIYPIPNNADKIRIKATPYGKGNGSGEIGWIHYKIHYEID